MNKKIKLYIPSQQSEWPVVGRDPKTGHVLLREGFIEAVEDASGLARGTISEDVIADMLVRWYFQRRQSGFSPCPITEELIREEFGCQIEIEVECSPERKQ